MKELTCDGCNGKCCSYVCTEIDEPENKRDCDNVIWYLLHEGVSVFIDEGEWYIQFDGRCKMLGKDGRCMIYDRRPNICRKLSIEGCERHGEGEPYEVIFREPEEFVEYMNKKGINIKF